MSNVEAVKNVFVNILEVMDTKCGSLSLDAVGNIYHNDVVLNIPPPRNEDSQVLAELDGFIDILYYVHFFCIRAKQYVPTPLALLVREFAEGSDPVNYGLPAKILDNNFIYRMVLSEMTEVLISYSSDNYMQLLRKCIAKVRPDAYEYAEFNCTIESIINSHLHCVFGDKWLDAFKVVHQANMNKAVDGKFQYDATGKIIKPVGWTPPDLRNFC